jgi:hypothetical protein
MSPRFGPLSLVADVVNLAGFFGGSVAGLSPTLEAVLATANLLAFLLEKR